MAIDFPASPSTNDTHTHNGLTWTFDGTTWKINTTVQSSSTTFTGLTDTPSSYTSHGSKFVKVNSATNGLEFGTGGGGLPIVNVADFGALPGAGGATNRTGIQNAIDSLASTGGLIYIPTGTYDITGTILIDQGVMGDGGGVSIIGPTQNYRVTAADTEGVCLRSTDANSDIIKVNNVRNVTFANLAFDHKDGTPRNGGNAIHCYSNVNTQQIRMDRIYIRNQFGGIKMDGHSISTFRDIEIRNFPLEGGCYGMLFSASAGGSERVDQVRCENVLIDGAIDGGGPHPHAIGLWVKDFVNSIWFLNCVSNRCNKGLLMDATVPSGSTGNPGSFFRINDCDFDTNNSYGIEIAGGSFIWINNPYISSNLSNGLYVNSTFTGVLRVNAADCRGNGGHGIWIRSTEHKKIFIRDSQCSHNGTSSSNNYDGLHIYDDASADQSDIHIDGGQYGGDMMGTTAGETTGGATPQRYGINFTSNSKYSRIIISNVDCSNNKQASLQFNPGNGSHNYQHNVIPIHASHLGGTH